MRQERCISSCKFNKNGTCLLYDATLEQVPDSTESFKCFDCMEKELSCSIDISIRDIQTLYDSFKDEMDVMFRHLDTLVTTRQDIYK